VSSLESQVEALHQAACLAQQSTYRDPTTGLRVFTAYGHQVRGYCCGSNCRHCPYEHENVVTAKPQFPGASESPTGTRVVSLCPSITETVFALGEGHRLVGRTEYCVQPPKEVSLLPTVGGTKSIRWDVLRDLKPDLILANQEENRREDVEQLRRMGIPVAVFFPKDLQTTANYIRDLATLLGADAGGELMASELEAMIKHEPVQTANVAYLIWRKPWMVAGEDTFIHSLLEAGGLSNVFAGSEETYPVVTAADLKEANPDLILLSSEPFPFEQKHRMELSKETGLPVERFLLVDGQLLSWHGVRTLEGIRYARSLGRTPHEV
jgi:iron complex transport system substrate-binding protein